MWCQLLYLIPGATLCSKFNYSDVTSLKPRLPQSFSFFFIEKIFKNVKCTVEMRTYSPGLTHPSSCTHLYVFIMTPSSPYLRTYFMDGPLCNYVSLYITKFFIRNWTSETPKLENVKKIFSLICLGYNF